jgi:hypothetical protein
MRPERLHLVPSEAAWPYRIEVPDPEGSPGNYRMEPPQGLAPLPAPRL